MELLDMTRSSQTGISNPASARRHANAREVQPAAFLQYCQSLPVHLDENVPVFKHCRRRIYPPSYLSAAKVTNIHKPRQGGLIFEWPLRRNKLIKKTNRFLVFVLWACSHLLYFLYRTHILPSAIAVEVRPPPLIIASILKPSPRLHCTIIEPDW